MQTFAFLATNQCGVLARLASIISSTSANIRRCTASDLPDGSLAVLSFEIDASEDQARAIERKASRLVDVLEVLWSTAGKPMPGADSRLRLANELRGSWERVA